MIDRREIGKKGYWSEVFIWGVGLGYLLIIFKRKLKMYIIQLYYSFEVWYKMSHQDISPALFLAQRSLSEQKQTNNIRKITIQSLAPIIAKLEQHITYLLEQTSKLRNENANLIVANASQKVLEKQMAVMHEDMDKLSTKLHAFNKDKDSKLKDRQHESKRILEQLETVQKQTEVHTKQIQQIGKNNDEYLLRIDQNKQQQLSSIDQLKSSIEQYYEQQLMKMESIRGEFEEMNYKIASLQQRRKSDELELKEISNITSLYSYQRSDIKKMIEKTSFLENNVVMLGDYEKDKRYQKIDNEKTKNDIRVMLDEALTPQIRKFLPKLISKLGQLQSFQATLDGIADNQKQNKQNHQNQMKEMSQLWERKFTIQQKSTERTFNEINMRINKNSDELDDKIMMNKQKTSQRLKSIQDELTAKDIRWRKNLEQGLLNLQNNLKEYLNVWGEQFLDRKKDNIYKLVQTQKPPQEHEEEKKVYQMVFSMQPLLNEVKQELKIAKKQVESSKQTLYERLSFFNNQIVKVKSDMTKEMTETKRILDNFNFKLIQNKDTCDELSLLVSKLTETTALGFALSIDQEYLHREHEVYVTYNDGILLEIGDNGLINYRRKEFIPQLLKRAVLSEIVKLIDSSVVNRPLLGWNRTQFKPSHLFQSIQSTYHAICDENRVADDQKPNKKSPYLDRKSLDHKQVNRKELLIHNPNKQASKDNEIFSKTISHQAGELRSFNSTARYDVGFQENRQDRQYSSRRKNIKLKKLEKKQP